MLFAFATGCLPHFRSSRRQFLLAAGGGSLAFLPAGPSLGADNDVVDLRPTAEAHPYRQARVVVETEGKLKLNADGQDVKHLPLKASADLTYFERTLPRSKSDPTFRALRQYRAAQAKIRLHESDLASELRTDRKLIALAATNNAATLFSPHGPLTREELDLLATPGSCLALESLLPPRPLKISSTWQAPDHAAARLLGLDAVSQHDLVCTLDSIKENLAIISLAGKVTGAVGGVSSDCELKGKLNFDLKQRLITWFTLAIKENRAIGHAQPGYEVLTTVRMVIAPIPPAADLSDKALAGLSLKPGPAETLVELRSEAGGFHLRHDRRWSVMLERPDLTVLRLVDRGDLIAQCNITPRPPLGKDEALTMEGFQADVKRVLGKNFEEIVEASEETADGGLRMLRVVVAGKAGELPIQWTYYHVANDKGRQASLVFTLESSLLERYATIDRELLGGFEFLVDKEPTAAESKSVRTTQAESTKRSEPIR